MFGFMLGTMSLLGLCAVASSHRRHHGWAGHGGCHGRRGWGGPSPEARQRRHAGMSAAAVEILKRRLRIDEDQEPYVDHAARDAHATLRTLREELDATRVDLAGAFRGEAVDDAAVDAAFARMDAALKTARRELVSAARQVHAVLEPEQRAAAADLLGRDVRDGWVL